MARRSVCGALSRKDVHGQNKQWMKAMGGQNKPWKPNQTTLSQSPFCFINHETHTQASSAKTYYSSFHFSEVILNIEPIPELYFARDYLAGMNVISVLILKTS